MKRKTKEGREREEAEARGREKRGREGGMCWV